MTAALLAATLAFAGPPPRDPGPPPRPDQPQQRALQPGWDWEPYARPIAGASVYTSGGQTRTSVTLGAEAGLRYWQTHHPPPRWAGRSRLQGATGLSSDVRNLDVRLGSFIGPQWELFGVEAGPDLFFNQATWQGQGLEPSLGVEVPVIGALRPDPFTLYAGFAPAWLTNPDRRVDWSEVAVPGFGHEFAYLAGVGLDLGAFGLSLSYSYRIVATGAQQGLGVGLRI